MSDSSTFQPCWSKGTVTIPVPVRSRSKNIEPIFTGKLFTGGRIRVLPVVFSNKSRGITREISG